MELVRRGIATRLRYRRSRQQTSNWPRMRTCGFGQSSPELAKQRASIFQEQVPQPSSLCRKDFIDEVRRVADATGDPKCVEKFQSASLCSLAVESTIYPNS